MNPFELFAMVACYEDVNSTKLSQVMWICGINFFAQLVYIFLFTWLYGSLKKSTLDNVSNSQAGPQKNSRRFRKWSSLIFIILGLTEIIIGFVHLQHAYFPECIWITIFNGVLTIFCSLYMLVDVFTTLPVNDRMKLIKECVFIFVLFVYMIIGFVGVSKVKAHEYLLDYTTYMLIALIALFTWVWIAGRNVYYRCCNGNQHQQNQGPYQNQQPNSNPSQTPQNQSSQIRLDDPFQHNDQITIGVGMNQVQVGSSNNYSNKKERLSRKNASDINFEASSSNF